MRFEAIAVGAVLLAALALTSGRALAEACSPSPQSCTDCIVAPTWGTTMDVPRADVAVVQFQLSQPVQNPADGLFYNRTRWVARCADGRVVAVCEQIHAAPTDEAVVSSAFASGANRLDLAIFDAGQCS